MRRPTVIKLGGSLFDQPDLAERFSKWMQDQNLGAVIVVPGGGATADVVRNWDQLHELGEEKSHWLALRAMTLNAWFLADVLPAFRVGDVADSVGNVILDAERFGRLDHGDLLPHSWDVTSDSIAARVAEMINAEQLILLKSVSIPTEMSWAKAAECGHVDPVFPRMMERAGYKLRVINFREI